MIQFIDRIVMLSVFYLIDISCTFYLITNYRQLFPKDKNWAETELNYVLRFMWKKFGVNKGTFFGAFVCFPFIFFIALLIIDDFLFGFIVGLYAMLFLIHVTSIRQILILKKQKDEKNKN